VRRNTIGCAIHGEAAPAFVCSHLAGHSVGLGFNWSEPDEDDEDQSPSGWCDNCDLIFEAHGEWNEESEKLIQIKLLCIRCFEQARIRNTRPSETLDDLADLKWKCGACDEVHSGPALDFGFDHPYQWEDDLDPQTSFLNPDYCVIKNEYFFVRGVIKLPIIGTDETFRWGVWGSLSKENFELMMKMDDDPDRVNLPPMFSWLSSRIPDYPDTLSLKMHGRLEGPEGRPVFELERTGHPLSLEYYQGISPTRVNELMITRLAKNV